MTKTKINLKPLVVIFLSIVTLAVTSLCLRQWNRTHQAGLGLRDGTEAFENKQWLLAAENLGKYIAIVPNDASVIMKYADAQINIVPMNINTINQALNSYRRVLRLNPTHKKAVLSLMDIYMQLLNSPAEAELIAIEFLKRACDSKVRRTLAISLYKQRKFTEAHQEVMGIIADVPTEVKAYAIAARFAEERPEDFSDAPEELYNQAINANPANPLAYIVRGEYFLRQSRKPEAINNFYKADSLSFLDVDIRVRLAKAFFDAGILDETSKHLAQASSADPDNISIWQLWAKLALTNQSAEEMFTIAQQGCESLSDDRTLFLPAAAELFIRSAHYDKANEAIEQLEQTDDSFAKVAFLQGLMARQQGDIAKAIDFWQKAYKAGLDTNEVTLPMVSALADSGDIDSAIIQLQSYITHENYLPRANFILAKYLAQTGEYRHAYEHIAKYLEYDPQNIKARLIASSLQHRIEPAPTDNIKVSLAARDKLQTELLSDSGKNSLSLSELITAISVAIDNQNLTLARQLIDAFKMQDPDNRLVILSEVQLLIAESLYDDSKIQESIEKVTALYNVYPNSIAPLLLHVRILKSDGQWNELANVVTKWYREHANDPMIVLTIVQQFIDYKKLPSVDCAEVILREIIAVDYDNVDALNSLGILLHITGRSKQALKYYEKVLMVDPDRIIAVNNMAWILCEEQNKYDQALELAATGLLKYPDYADLIDTAGVASYRLGKYEESINYFKKCIKLRNSSESEIASVHFHIARSFEKNGNLKEALNHLEKATEIYKLNGGLSSSELAEVNMLLSEITERY